MSFKPIDIMKSQGVSQYKHIESQRFQHEQVQISKNMQNMIQQGKQKTVETSKSENKEYRYDAKEKGNGSYYGKRGNPGKKSKQNDGGKENDTPMKSGRIDILL